MDLEQSQKGQSCCLAVMSDLSAAGLACLELHLGNSLNLAISVLNKPEADANCRNFIRVKSVGTIVCRGCIARTLKQRSIGSGDALWEMSTLLNLVGVPEHHEGIYNQALKSGLVIIILQGLSAPVRQGCQILNDKALGKPVLYLG